MMLNIGRDDAYGFGDSANNLPLLDAVGHGVMMGGAPDHIRGNFLCAEPMDEDGLSRILARLNLI